MIATYAVYPWCEGDDPWTESVVITTDDPERTREELQVERGGHIQLWDIS